LVNHEYQEAGVEQHECNTNSVEALQPNILDCFDVGLQIRKGAHKEYD